MKTTNLPIGVFDSGLGGLTVLNALKNILPHESFIYFGDTAHVPYGNKSKDSIVQFSQAIIRFLDSQPVKLIVVACNTVSSIALNKIKTQTPIISVLDPIEEYFLINKKLRLSVGIIGTENTIQSQSYVRLINKFNTNIAVYSQSCPLLVPIIEEGLEDHTITKIILMEYLESLKKQNISLLILGCTHYPVIKKITQQILGKEVAVFDSAQSTAVYVNNFLIKNKLLYKNLRPVIDLYVSDNDIKFKFLSKKFLNHQINLIKKIQI